MAGLKKKSSATASFTGISEASSSKRKRKSKSKKRDSLEPSGSKLDESYYNDDSSKISMEQVSETSMVEDQVESGSIRPRNKLSGKESNVLENSTLKFTDINFLVGKKDNKKHILTNVSGEVKHGHVLAIMGCVRTWAHGNNLHYVPFLILFFLVILTVQVVLVRRL